MEDRICRNCKYFKQHYALDEKDLFRVFCGHCTQPKVRRKEPTSKACALFVESAADEDAFARKEYLSKKLLQYLLNLELLPEIKDTQ